ncbi:MAG: TlpA family protein disulfide reductase [Cyclobacteriaceae bacterium]
MFWTIKIFNNATKKVFRLKCLLLLFVFTSNQPIYSQDMDMAVEVIKYPRLLELLDKPQAMDIEVFNFWATWCGPCVKELPYFEKLSTQYDNVKVFLISFDDVEKLETSVKNFINKRNLKSKIFLVDETDYNSFIDKVDARWSGAIPATIIIDRRSGERLFYEKEFEEGELNEIIDKLNP